MIFEKYLLSVRFFKGCEEVVHAYQCSISVCETDKVIRDAAHDEGYSAVPEITSDDFRDNQIFVAMTGNKSFGKKELMKEGERHPGAESC